MRLRHVLAALAALLLAGIVGRRITRLEHSPEPADLAADLTLLRRTDGHGGLGGRSMVDAAGREWVVLGRGGTRIAAHKPLYLIERVFEATPASVRNIAEHLPILVLRDEDGPGDVIRAWRISDGKLLFGDPDRPPPGVVEAQP